MCKYCKVDADLINKKVKVKGLVQPAKFRVGAYITEDNQLGLDFWFDNTFLVEAYKKIKYCPMCGRKLEEDTPCT